MQADVDSSIFISIKKWALIRNNEHFSEEYANQPNFSLDCFVDVIWLISRFFFKLKYFACFAKHFQLKLFIWVKKTLSFEYMQALLLEFLKNCLRRRKFGETRFFIVIWGSSENQFGRPKKSLRKILKFFFENPPHPLEKFLDPRLLLTNQNHRNL